MILFLCDSFLFFSIILSVWSIGTFVYKIVSVMVMALFGGMHPWIDLHNKTAPIHDHAEKDHGQQMPVVFNSNKGKILYKVW